MSGKQLDEFLKQWRSEISSKQKHNDDLPKTFPAKRKNDSSERVRTDGVKMQSKLSEYVKKSKVNSGGCFSDDGKGQRRQDISDISDSKSSKTHVSRIKEYLPSTFDYVNALLDDDGEEMIADKSISNDLSKEEMPKSNAGDERLVDILLADLDEINEIPFFDLTIPREVAMNIFHHFNIVDLCRCAQVSRSWRHLAEDELLWCRVCHQLGYDLEAVTADKAGWKHRAREVFMRAQKLRLNWKNRVGRVSELAYVQGGVLCAADSLGSLVCGGYSSGQVCVWDLDSGLESVYRPSSTSLVIDERCEAGTLRNLLTGVRLGRGLVTAAYSQGVVDIWHMDASVTPVHTARAPSRESHQSQVTCQVTCHPARPLTAYSHQRTLNIVQVAEMEHYPGGRYGATVLNTTDFGQNIEWLKFVPETADHVVCQTGHVVRLVAPSTPRCQLPVLHEMVDAKVACCDVSADRLCVGVTSYGLLDGCKIQVYEIAGGRLLTSLAGIGGMGLRCLNVSDSPPNMVISAGQDRRVFIHDLRVPAPVRLLYPDLLLRAVQMDEEKAVVAGTDGHTCVYDLRTGNKLWQFHNRHPVAYSRFDAHRLITANVPSCQDAEDSSENHMTHKRFRGGIHVYDFSVSNETEGVPTICKSSYDPRTGYNYNIGLAVPYDNL